MWRSSGFPTTTPLEVSHHCTTSDCSGIGPSKDLQKHGIAVEVDLLGVGAHLVFFPSLCANETARPHLSTSMLPSSPLLINPCPPIKSPHRRKIRHPIPPPRHRTIYLPSQ